MSSLNRLRKRNNTTYYSDNIYEQYIEDYKIYFESSLNKTDYIDYYDKSIIGKGIILDVSFNNANNGDEKYITTLPNSNLYIGQILSLKFENDIKFWLITEKEHLAIPSHDKFKMRPCNYILKYMMDGEYHEIPSIVTNNTKYTGGTKTLTSGFTEVDAMINITTQNNENTRKIDYGKRLYVMKNAWQVTLIDNITTENTFSWTLGKDSLNSEIDDIVNGICDAFEHSYAISLNSNSQTLVETETYKIVPNVTDKGVVVTNPKVTYTSSDENIAKVDSTGLVTALSVGSCIITCSIGNVSANLSLNVNAKSVDNITTYSCDWTSTGTTLKTYAGSTAQCAKYINGIKQGGLVISYEIDSVGQSLLSSNKIAITKVNDYSVQIRNKSVSSTNVFTIIIKDSSDNSVITNQQITLTGM